MKKLLQYGITIAIILFMMPLNIYSYANENETQNPSVKYEIESQNLDNNQLEVLVKLTDLKNIGEGVNALTANIAFDSENLEFTKFEQVDNWNMPVSKVNGNTIKIATTSSNFIDKENTAIKVIFNKKNNKDNYEVKISDLELAAKVDGNTVKVVATNVSETTNTNTNTSKSSDQNIDASKLVAIVGIIAIILIICCLIFTGKKKKEEK